MEFSSVGNVTLLASVLLVRLADFALSWKRKGGRTTKIIPDTTRTVHMNLYIRNLSPKKIAANITVGTALHSIIVIASPIGIYETAMRSQILKIPENIVARTNTSLILCMFFSKSTSQIQKLLPFLNITKGITII